MCRIVCVCVWRKRRRRRRVDMASYLYANAIYVSINIFTWQSRVGVWGGGVCRVSAKSGVLSAAHTKYDRNGG